MQATSSKATTRVAVVGVGRAGMMHARNFANNHKDCDLAAVCDADASAASQAAAELGLGADGWATDYRVVIDRADVQAVCVASPTHTHAEIVVRAAAAGKHVLCEKPMARTPDECDRMDAAAREAGVTLMIGFMRRFDPGFVKAWELISSGVAGRPVLIRSLTRGPGLPPAWYYPVSQSNGLLAEVNSHDFDTLAWFAGSRFKQVYAVAGNFRCPDIGERFPDFYDTALVTARFENGVLGTIDGSCPAGYGYDARAEVLCAEGTVFVGRAREGDVTVWTREHGSRSDAFRSWTVRFRDAYLAEEEHFMACIRGGEDPLCGALEGKNALAAVIACNESIRTGQPVSIDY